MKLLTFGHTAWMTLLLVGLCACGNQGDSDTGDNNAGDPQARSERLSEIQTLTRSAREAYDQLDGVWDAKAVYTTPSGAKGMLETELTFERAGGRVTWAEAYDRELMDVQLGAAELRVTPLVQPKTLLLVAGFDEGFVYVNKLHLVFDEHATFDAGAKAREKLYDKIRGGQASVFDELSVEIYQPYVVRSAAPDRIVLERPARVFPEAIEQALNANEDNPDQLGGRLELILTRRAQ
jgi:hypothetical protein